MASKAASIAEKARVFQGLGLYFRDELQSSSNRWEKPTRLNRQRVSRIGLGLTDSLIDRLPTSRNIEPAETDISRWSSDSSESDYEKSDNGMESEVEEYIEETVEQKLQRHRRYFEGEPLMRCLKEEEAHHLEWMDALFYDNLCHEVQHKVQETRRQDVVKEYWRNVHETLAIDDSEISDTSDLMTESEDDHGDRDTVVCSYMGFMRKRAAGWKRPSNICPSSGKDLDLQEVRDLLTGKKKKLGRAKTLGKVEGQISGNISMSFREEDLGRAATFG
ncbi:hypothetical protein ONS95_005912 [Cadophora gregata]|uniref:uncharacterized protein n=1 Tax=Cadophora gregata TaxID=51156 RepID=UPI0026DAF407|nr:uncharacterized protein ONS95_005912 [Cadophora gregata]KAK0102289.1 hypothetical protein ONS95_005912 [Cadophora gregata]